MGLDGVEIVLEIEDRFRIDLPDAECSNVRTVADLAAIVISHMPRATLVCPTARTFFEIRKHLVQQCGLDRRTLRPTTSLESVFPREVRRYRWKRLSGAERLLPQLRLSKAKSRAFDAIGVLLMLLVAASFVALMLQGYGYLGGVLFVCVLVAGVFAFVRLRQHWANEFPDGCNTLGDLAKEITPQVMPIEDGERLIAEHRVLEQVRLIVSNQLGVQLDEVTPQSRLVEDLGMD